MGEVRGHLELPWYRALEQQEGSDPKHVCAPVSAQTHTSPTRHQTSTMEMEKSRACHLLPRHRHLGIGCPWWVWDGELKSQLMNGKEEGSVHLSLSWCLWLTPIKMGQNHGVPSFLPYPHLRYGEEAVPTQLSEEDLSFDQKQNPQDLGYCHCFAFGAVGKMFCCNSLLHTSSVFKMLKCSHACVAFLMIWYMCEARWRNIQLISWSLFVG